MVAPLFVGNALRLWIEPPDAAVRWRVLRKTSNTFAGAEDPSALVVYEGTDHCFVDAKSLTNGVEVWYAPFWTADGSTWTAGALAYATPSATYEETTTDAQSLVRERLESGLQVEVQRGNLVHDLGHIQVFQAAPSMEGDLRFPLVTVHLDYEEPADRFLGEDITGGLGDESLEDSAGWLANVGLTIVGWSLNADERAEMRRALRRIILGNLNVFDDKGLQQVSVKFQDVDAISGEYGAPVYQIMATFTCLAPVRVGAPVDAFAGDMELAING